MTDPQQLQKQALRMAEQGQAATANLVHTLAETGARGGRPAAGVGPGPSSQPTPAEVIDRSFDFTIQMLETQRAFAHQMLEAGTPSFRAMEQTTASVTEKSQQGTAKGSGAASGTDSGTSTPR